jgi:prephenate dehydratase
MRYGIQGGPASFNDLALKDYTSRHTITDAEIEYLFTTEKVLHAIETGAVDFGLFAVHNSVGGMVTESLEAMSKHIFTIVEEFPILISHNLMKLPQVPTESIHTIMAHDQVLKQCVKNLSLKYPMLTQKVGEGDLIDTATAAKAIVDGILPQEIFILGNPLIAPTFGFETVDTNLQDSANNLTTFLLVKR